jgi:hypothetical protein
LSIDAEHGEPTSAWGRNAGRPGLRWLASATGRPTQTTMIPLKRRCESHQSERGQRQVLVRLQSRHAAHRLPRRHVQIGAGRAATSAATVMPAALAAKPIEYAIDDMPCIDCSTNADVAR